MQAQWFEHLILQPAGLLYSSPHHGDGTKGPFSFAKENGPFGTPRERRFPLQASSSKSCNACRLHFPARGVAAFRAAIRFASASIIRCCAAVGSFAALRMRHTPCGCRSACDSLALRNLRLLRICTNLLLPAKAALLRSLQYALPRRYVLPIVGD